MSARDDFYVGYLGEAPPDLARWLRARVAGLLLLSGLVALLATATQRDPGPGAYELGVERSFEGWLLARPVPHLLVERPGQSGAAAEHSRYLLTVSGKHGAAAVAERHAGRRVRLRGRLVYRDARTMVEVDPGSVEDLGGEAAPASAPVVLGERTFRGEIVDSKCYWGVMKPGRSKPHRGCAARCIAGGVPPVLLVRDGGGRATTLLLVDERGGAVNGRVRGLVAEPVEITGRLERHGDLPVLFADPAAYRRLE